MIVRGRAAHAEATILEGADGLTRHEDTMSGKRRFGTLREVLHKRLEAHPEAQVRYEAERQAMRRTLGVATPREPAADGELNGSVPER